MQKSGKMRISVIMPVFNGAATLPRALDSLVDQTCSEFELIAVDDGSTDCSAEILQSYSDCIAMHIVSQANQGASVARNVGLDMVQGEFVYMMDCDDVVHPRLFEKVLSCFARSDCDVLLFDSRCVLEDEMPDFSFGISEEGLSSAAIPGDALAWFVGHERAPGLWQFVFRAGVLSDRRFVPGITLEDNLFVFPVLADRTLRFRHLPLVGYAYVQREDSVMHSSSLEWRLRSLGETLLGLAKTLDAQQYRLLAKAHYPAEIKSMWREAPLRSLPMFARFIQMMMARSLLFSGDFKWRWRVRFSVWRWL